MNIYTNDIILPALHRYMNICKYYMVRYPEINIDIESDLKKLKVTSPSPS